MYTHMQTSTGTQLGAPYCCCHAVTTVVTQSIESWYLPAPRHHLPIVLRSLGMDGTTHSGHCYDSGWSIELPRYIDAYVLALYFH